MTPQGITGHLRQLQRISSIELEAKRHLGGWAERRLADITRTECRARHKRLTDTAERPDRG